MKVDRSVTSPIRSTRSALALTAVVLGLSLVAATPADAMPVPGPVGSCLSFGDGQPLLRRAADTPAVTAAVRDRVQREVERAAADAPLRAGVVGERSAADFPVYRVKVQVHVIHGKHRGERKIGRKAARKKIFRILKNAYNGGQSTVSAPMGFDFRLKRITISTNDRWFHAAPMSAADQQMKRRLHRGGATTLNIYVNKPNVAGNLLLGYSRFPWQYRKHKSLDGVTINVRSLPKGTAWGYNLGDSVVHETGHWLGLWHTFQGGCDPVNDGVADTPAEKSTVGNFDCANADNLCHPSDLATMADPAYNFMEYTKDACMRMFTPGQRRRADQMFATYRLGR